MSYSYTTEEFNLTPKEQEAARFLLQEAKVLSSQPQDDSWNIRYSTFENFKRQFYRQLITRLNRTDWENFGISTDGKRAIHGRVFSSRFYQGISPDGRKGIRGKVAKRLVVGVRATRE